MWYITSVVIITNRGNSFKFITFRWLIIINLYIGTKLDGGGDGWFLGMTLG